MRRDIMKKAMILGVACTLLLSGCGNTGGQTGSTPTQLNEPAKQQIDNEETIKETTTKEITTTKTELTI